MKKYLIIFLVNLCSFYANSQTQAFKSSFDFGPATNLDGPVGISFSYSHFDKLCAFLDYLGVVDKDGFIYHEFSSKFGLCAKQEMVCLSLSGGMAIAFYPERNTNQYFTIKKNSPFFGIPIQARIDLFTKSVVGCGLKLSYIPSLVSDYDAHKVLAFFISIRFEKD